MPRGYPQGRTTGYRYVGPRELARERTGADLANDLADAITDGLSEAAKRGAPAARTALWAVRRAMWANVAIPIVAGGIGQLLYGANTAQVPVTVTDLAPGGWIPWGSCAFPDPSYNLPAVRAGSSAFKAQNLKTLVEGCTGGSSVAGFPMWNSPVPAYDYTINYMPRRQTSVLRGQHWHSYTRPVAGNPLPPTVWARGTQAIPVALPSVRPVARPVPGTVPFEPAIAPVRALPGSGAEPHQGRGGLVWTRPGISIEAKPTDKPTTPVVVKPHENKPPPRKTNEKKASPKGRTAAFVFALGAAVSAVTETTDLIDALFWALPKDKRAQYYKFYRKPIHKNFVTTRHLAEVSIAVKAQAVLEQWEHIDPGKAARNVIEETAADLLIGGMSRATKGALQKAIDKGYTHSNRNPLPTRMGADYGLGSFSGF